ncbi:MAG TPA: choice-of-anchor X domain-containing protein [Kofleriaceae bacterium]
MRTKLAIAAGAIAVAVVLLLLLLGTDRPAPAAHPREQYAAARVRDRPAVAPDKGLIEGGAPSVALLEQSLADYKAVSVYPHWSRPHSAETIEKLEWNRTVVSDLPMDDRPGHETIYRFSADRWSVGYGEAFVSSIEVVTAGTQKRLPITVKEARLVSVERGRITSLRYHDDGQDGDAVAGDHRYSNRVVPSQLASLADKAQQVHIEAVVEAGGVTRSVTRDFAYAPRKVAESVGATEHLQGGNLVVRLELDITEKGLYTFEANVLARDGTPIVYGEKSYPLEPGKRTADIVMFGRALREKGLDGPYVVRDIRGMRRFVDTDEQNFFFTYAPTLTTRAYRHDEFSDAEWDEPERRDTIANFERLIEQTRSGEVGAVDDDPALPTITPSSEPPPAPGPNKSY